MAKLNNLVGIRFGKLVVLERDTSKKGVYWICQCDCGKIISTRSDTLTRDKHPKTSCGCDLFQRNSEAHVVDETGNRHGYLTVIKRIPSDRPAARWLCQCDCGNLTEVDGCNLRNGTVQSCGCKLYESKNGIDETGKKYGKLTVLEQAPRRNNNTHIYWKCKCECGNIIEVQGTYLRKGSARHCGCEISAGESKITYLLAEHNIKFKKQITFPDLLGDNNTRLRYDFGIFNETDELQYIIEFDGKQHFEPNCFYNTIEDLTKIKRYDQIKNSYCQQHNIPLIRIKYTNFLNLTINDLIPNTTKYLTQKIGDD